MRSAVIDASVVIKWFKADDEADLDAALAILEDFRDGALVLGAPSLLALEVLNSLGRRWRWPAEGLQRAASTFADLPIDLVEPELTGVARWITAGLTAYDSAYLAVAEQLGVPLVTADERMLAIDRSPAVTLADF